MAKLRTICGKKETGKEFNFLKRMKSVATNLLTEHIADRALLIVLTAAVAGAEIKTRCIYSHKMYASNTR